MYNTQFSWSYFAVVISAPRRSPTGFEHRVRDCSSKITMLARERMDGAAYVWDCTTSASHNAWLAWHGKWGGVDGGGERYTAENVVLINHGGRLYCLKTVCSAYYDSTVFPRNCSDKQAVFIAHARACRRNKEWCCGAAKRRANRGWAAHAWPYTRNEKWQAIYPCQRMPTIASCLRGCRAQSIYNIWMVQNSRTTAA